MSPKRNKMRKQRNRFQTNKQKKTQYQISQKDLSDTEINNLCHKELKVMVIKMHTELERRDESSENFNKEIENLNKYQNEVTELKNTVTKLKNTLRKL